MTSQVPSCPMVFACDESYAMPLATALRSIVEANQRNQQLDVYVLSDGFSANMRQKVVGSLPQGSALIRWVDVDLTSFEEFSTAPYISKMTYARLMIPRIFTDSVARVLYLDADLIALDDLGPLWDTDLDGAVLGAVLDTLDADLKVGVLGLEKVPRVQNYFNAGVLLIDLNRWREERISENAIEYLRCNPHSPFADQDALNVACDGRWAALDKRWNFQQHYTTAILDILPSLRPKIVHFVTSLKPWNASMSSLNADLYNAFRSRTRFARTGLDEARHLVSSTWRRLKQVLKRASFVRAIWNEVRRWGRTGRSGPSEGHVPRQPGG